MPRKGTQAHQERWPPQLVMRVTIELRPHAGPGMMLESNRDITTEMRMLRSAHDGVAGPILIGIAAEQAAEVMSRAVGAIRAADEKARKKADG